jgi:hypothetical protein
MKKKYEIARLITEIAIKNMGPTLFLLRIQINAIEFRIVKTAALATAIV